MTETKPPVPPTPPTPEPPKVEETSTPTPIDFQVTFKCDGCGKKESARIQRSGTILRPANWFDRMDDKGYQIACSRECIIEVAKKTGRTSVVLPV